MSMSGEMLMFVISSDWESGFRLLIAVASTEAPLEVLHRHAFQTGKESDVVVPFTFDRIGHEEAGYCDCQSGLGRDQGDADAVGDKIDARVTSIDASGRQLSLSVKAREIQEEKKAMQEYGSSDSGASLGDILGAALQSRRESAAEEASDSDGDAADKGGKA